MHYARKLLIVSRAIALVRVVPQAHTRGARSALSQVSLRL